MALAEHNPRDTAEFESPPTSSVGEDTEATKVALYHNHLPCLDEAGFINWNRESNIVTRGPNFEEVHSLITLLNGHQDEHTKDVPEFDER